METLLEDYKRKLKTAESMLENGMAFGDEQENRIKIKASVYRSAIVDIERAMARQQQQSSANCAIFDVSQQRELLYSFITWHNSLPKIKRHYDGLVTTDMVEDFIKE